MSSVFGLEENTLYEIQVCAMASCTPGCPESCSKINLATKGAGERTAALAVTPFVV